jgi:hypothetical protein
MAWRNGEHCLVVARTGSGKTVLVNNLMLTRPWAAVIVTKPEDDSAMWLKDHHGFRIARTWDDTYPTVWERERHNRWLIWPDSTGFDSRATQAITVRGAMAGAWHDRGWALGVDEAQYVADRLGLRDELAQLFLQARSLKVSVVAASQRPRNLGVEALTQSTHLFFLKSHDDYDLGRIEEIVGSRNAELIELLMPTLDDHEFLYLNTVTGEAYRSRVPADLAP